MTQATTPIDATVAALQESVRHNEKNIDRLDRDLKDFRSETLKQFEKVDQRFDQLEAKFDQRFEKVDDRFNQITMLLVAIVGLIVAAIVKLVFLSF
jgi:tetrahydromethanopterin S-methyltransferase subunit G